MPDINSINSGSLGDVPKAEIQIGKTLNELETNKCKCSKGFGRDLMKVFSLFYIILLIITFVFVCSIYITNNNKPISKNTNLEYGNMGTNKRKNLSAARPRCPSEFDGGGGRRR